MMIIISTQCLTDSICSYTCSSGILIQSIQCIIGIMVGIIIVMKCGYSNCNQ